jgi:hypothetical protein
MASGPETRFIQSIHKKLPKTVYHEKMHNPYRGGTPDVWYSGKLRDLWIEYKWGKNKPRKLQKDWITKRRAEGRTVWVVTGTPDGCEVNDGIEILKLESKTLLVDLLHNFTTGEIIETSKKPKRASKRKR